MLQYVRRFSAVLPGSIDGSVVTANNRRTQFRFFTNCNVIAVKQDAALKHVYELPADTFGGAYAQFMRKRQFHADDRCECLWMLM